MIPVSYENVTRGTCTTLVLGNSREGMQWKLERLGLALRRPEFPTLGGGETMKENFDFQPTETLLAIARGSIILILMVDIGRHSDY